MMITQFLKNIAFAAFLVVLPAGLFAQSINLANQYFANGEYEKAAAVFGEIVEKNP